MAAINFPSSPSNGDTHVVGGVTYTYNSAETKWKTTINSNAFLPLSGGTVSGTLTVNDDLAVDTDTLFVDVSTDRVGINTTSPSAFLHVQNGEIVKDQDSSQNSANPGFQIKHNGTINGSWRHDGRLEVGGQDANADVRLDTEGIKFNGDTAAANALDDYEEGTWAPYYSSPSATTPNVSDIVSSYQTRNGRYTKIGRQVFVEGYISLPGSGSWSYQNGGAAGQNLVLAGLPFVASASSTYPSLSVGYFANWPGWGAGYTPMGYLETGSSHVQLTYATTNGITNLPVDHPIANNAGFLFSLTYTVP